MTDPDALLEACLAAPDDDAPRLVWADAIGGERGELVVIQCDLARGDLPPADVVRRKQREHELLGRHAVAWSGLRGLATACTYQRGLVEAVAVDVEHALEHHAAIARAAPLATLCLGGLDENETDQRAEHAPALVRRLLEHDTRWRGLALGNATIEYEEWESNEYNWLASPPYLSWESLVDEMIVAIAPLVGRPRTFKCIGVGCRGARALLDANAFADVERLVLKSPQVEAEWGAIAMSVIAAAPRLTALELDLITGEPHADVVHALPDTLVELTMRAGDDTIETLARTAIAGRLERLSLPGRFHRTHALSAFSRLRSLDFGDVRFGAFRDPASTRDAIAMLAAAVLPALRELRITDPEIEAASVSTIVDAFGAQLELLDVRGVSQVDDAVAAQLAPRVAGELRAGPLQYPDLLHVGTTRGPWWDRPALPLA